MQLHRQPLVARRVVTIPTVLVATVVVLVTLPLLIVVAAVVDLASGPRRLRMLRLLAMGLYYLVLECAGIVCGLVLWVGTGFGLTTRSHRGQLRHHRVQQWWTRSIMHGLRRFLGADISIEGGDALATGPAIVVSHHISFFDAVLPSVIAADTNPNMLLRHSLKRELLLSPSLDIFGNRLRNYFVDRAPADRTRELRAFANLASDLETDAVVVFPEGTFHSPARAARAHSSIEASDPERAARVAGLRHVLPMRPGGVMATLDAAPGVDLVFVAHRGFEAFWSLKDIMANVPFRAPVQACLWRIPAADVPRDAAERLAFLDAQWRAVDDWIASTVVAHEHAAAR